MQNADMIESMDQQTTDTSEKISNLLASILASLIELKEQFIASVDIVGRGWLEFTTFSDYWSIEHINLKVNTIIKINTTILIHNYQNAVLKGLITILAYRSPLSCTESWLLQGLSYGKLQDQTVQCLLVIANKSPSNGDTSHESTDNRNDVQVLANVKSTNKRTISIEDSSSSRKRPKLTEPIKDK
jgi:hypothetical protein